MSLLVAASGCSGSKGSSACAGACQGCCDADGMCLAGTSESACGKNGSTCSSCPSGKKCVNGTCQTAACGSATCDGCCSAGGTCIDLTAQSVNTCGARGAACTVCPSSTACTGGACQTAGCSASSCTGCCSSGICFTFDKQNSAVCGKGGAACTTCPSGSPCTSGTCGACNATNCAQGCCSGGQCILYAQQGAAACGTGGAACAACSSQCTNGVCSGSCNATSCASGCCQGSTCIVFAAQTDLVCGKTGAACVSCGTVKCVNGACADSWKLGVTSCVGAYKPSGDWDPFGTTGKDPDPMVFVTVKASNVTGQTKFIDDTLTPTFNQDILTDSSTNLTNPAGIVAEIRDDDSPLGFEVMGQCTTTLTTADLQAGTKTVTACTNQAKSVILRFSK